MGYEGPAYRGPFVSPLEDQLGGHLQLTGWEEAGDAAEAAIAAIGIRCGVVDVVQQVEGLAANIEQRCLIPETKALVKAEIQLIEGVITQSVAPGIPMGW